MTTATKTKATKAAAKWPSLPPGLKPAEVAPAELPRWPQLSTGELKPFSARVDEVLREALGLALALESENALALFNRAALDEQWALIVAETEAVLTPILEEFASIAADKEAELRAKLEALRDERLQNEPPGVKTARKLWEEKAKEDLGAVLSTPKEERRPDIMPGAIVVKRKEDLAQEIQGKIAAVVDTLEEGADPVQVEEYLWVFADHLSPEQQGRLALRFLDGEELIIFEELRQVEADREEFLTALQAWAFTVTPRPDGTAHRTLRLDRHGLEGPVAKALMAVGMT